MDFHPRWNPHPPRSGDCPVALAGNRRAAVAGTFYPASPEALRQTAEALLAGAPPAGPGCIKAVVSPHAGYLYSGPIAASAVAQFAPAREAIRRIVLLGPSHFVHVPGLALPTVAAFETPLGPVPVDPAGWEAAAALPGVEISDRAHGREHSLEVQLPLLQVALSGPGGRAGFSIVPVVAGDASPEQVRALLDALWSGPETRFVISSDLSHYLDAGSARRLDAVTARAIERLDPDGLGEDQACGRVPLRGLLATARARGLEARVLDLRNSGDTAGPPHRVVGYGAFAFAAGG